MSKGFIKGKICLFFNKHMKRYSSNQGNANKNSNDLTFYHWIGKIFED